MAKTKFEALIEHIINDEQDAAKELFHDIVVEKSREIYNNLVAETEEEMEESLVGEMDGEDATDDMADDVAADEEGLEADDMDDAGADLGDEMGVGGDDMGGEGDELEDRVVDLEAALDELKAEFDSLMADEEGEAEHDFGGDDMGDDMGGDDMDADFGDEDMEAEEPMPEGMVREYVEKVAMPAKGEGQTVGSNSSSKPTVNTKSIVAGKNDMGGTTANIAKGGSNAAPDGQTPPKAPSNAYKTNSAQEIDVAKRNVNVPGGKGASNFFNGKPKAKTGEESGTNDKSPLAKG